MLKKSLIGGLVLSSLLVGCAPTEDPVEGVTLALPEPVAIRYNEFIWCSNGPNFSAENLAKNFDFWVDGMQNTLQQKRLAAVSLTPRGWSNDDFDRLHLMMWPDKIARDAGWAAYAESGLEQAEAAAFPGLEKCGGDDWQDVFGFNVYQPRPPTVMLDPATDKPVVGYRFCAMNAGKNRADLRAVIYDSFIPYLDALAVSAGPSAYNFLIQVPDFVVESRAGHEGVPVTWDYVWTNTWPSAAAYEASNATWSVQGQALQAAFDAVATCSQEQAYDLTPIMAAAE